MNKTIRIGVWVFFMLLSLVLLSPNPFAQGVTVDFVSSQSPAHGILSPNDIILRVNQQSATPELFAAAYTGNVIFDTTKGTRVVPANGTLGISVINTPNTNLHFGLDIRGGVRALVEPNTTDDAVVDEVMSTLETRINLFGLREAVFRKLKTDQQTFVEISMAGGDVDELQSLLETQGTFAAKIPFALHLTNRAGTIQLDKSYTLQVFENTLTVNGNNYTENETFVIEDIPFTYTGVQENSAQLTATVFASNDIKNVFFDPQRSTITLASDGSPRWSFGIQVSNEGATRFKKVTQNLGFVPGGSLDAPIQFYLDNGLIDSLSISSGLKGQFQTEVSITGGSESRAAAIEERSRLQSILRSGALPVSIHIVQVDRLSPNLGEQFLSNAALAGLGAIVGIFVVVFLRYRHPKLVFPMVVVSLSEVLIILGLATALGWTIDLAAIGAIIATVGTGVDSQIILLDRTLRKGHEDETLKQKMQQAFFVIFGSAGTVIAAMLPLLVLGFGLLRGFALVTMIGVLTGVLITRPAYGVIVEKLSKQ